LILAKGHHRHQRGSSRCTRPHLGTTNFDQLLRDLCHSLIACEVRKRSSTAIRSGRHFSFALFLAIGEKWSDLTCGLTTSKSLAFARRSTDSATTSGASKELLLEFIFPCVLFLPLFCLRLLRVGVPPALPSLGALLCICFTMQSFLVGSILLVIHRLQRTLLHCRVATSLYYITSAFCHYLNRSVSSWCEKGG